MKRRLPFLIIGGCLVFALIIASVIVVVSESRSAQSEEPSTPTVQVKTGVDLSNAGPVRIKAVQYICGHNSSIQANTSVSTVPAFRCAVTGPTLVSVQLDKNYVLTKATYDPIVTKQEGAAPLGKVELVTSYPDVVVPLDKGTCNVTTLCGRLKVPTLIFTNQVSLRTLSNIPPEVLVGSLSLEGVELLG